ncbi:MAG: small basic protein [Planctomycetota bacterium]|jgi:small basic protein (TIGR04137 family)
MSVHKSLKLKGSLQRARNVLRRAERIELMKARGSWKEGRSIYALPKTRVVL